MIRTSMGAGLLIACTAGWAAAAPGASAPTGAASAVDPAAQARQIETLQWQLQAVQVQLQQLADQNRALMRHQEEIERQLAQQRSPAASATQLGTQSQAGLPPPETSPLPGPSAATPSSASASSGASLAGVGAEALENIKLWGYGEVYYNRPKDDSRRTQADLARAVFGIGYRFDPRTEFNSEYEVEHAIASASDAGEFEVEQFYVDRQVTDRIAVRGGLFLLPFGMLNEHHEPTSFYGVQRNFVETLIIPSTWREGGVSFHGDSAAGMGWNVGVTTGFDLSKWNYTPTYPQYTTALELENTGAAPLRATHQELSLANGRDLTQYVALSYYGLPGLLIGSAISTGKAVPVSGSTDQRVTLWEGHARWTPGKFDLSALYAHGAISNTAAANLANPGSPNPIPAAFNGYFVQGAYGLWEHGDYRLAPFARWESYNLGSQYAGTRPNVPTGTVPLSSSPGDFGLWPRNHDRVWSLGANFYTTPHVVLKADYQWFDVNQAFNRFDLGLGVSF